MQNNGKCQLLRIRMLSGAVVVANALAAQGVVAQSATTPSAAASAAGETLEEVVVTGTNTA